MARTNNLSNFLTDVSNAIKEKKGDTTPIKASEFDNEIKNLPSGGGKGYTGSYDVEGLKTIGWTDEDINYYQENGVVWNEEDNNDYKLTQDELLVTDIKNTRFIPKNSTLTTYKYREIMIALPRVTISENSMYEYFSSCNRLITIPQLDTSNITSLAYTFRDCYSLITIPQLDTSKCRSFSATFNSCYSLMEIPQLDTSNATDLSNMFAYCYRLRKIPKLNAIKVYSISGMFQNCYSLTTMEGLENLGSAFGTSTSANYYNYKLDLSYSKNLSHRSLMNVINNLFDIATKGCNTQSLVLGTNNISKLTQEELAIATNKGWTIS